MSGLNATSAAPQSSRRELILRYSVTARQKDRQRKKRQAPTVGAAAVPFRSIASDSSPIALSEQEIEVDTRTISLRRSSNELFAEVIIRPSTSAASVASMPMPMCAELRASLASSSGGSHDASRSPNQRPAHAIRKTVAEMAAAITRSSKRQSSIAPVRDSPLWAVA